MSTRSTIALEYADGTVYQSYAHWDGYLEHNGRILFEHYSDPFKLDQLIQLGSVSSLGAEIGDKHPFSPNYTNNPELSNEENARIGAEIRAAYDAAVKAGATTFYGRDRGETGTEAYSFANFGEYAKVHQYEEFEYILRQVEGKAVWFVSSLSTNGNYCRLEQALDEITALEAN